MMEKLLEMEIIICVEIYLEKELLRNSLYDLIRIKMYWIFESLIFSL